MKSFAESNIRIFYAEDDPVFLRNIIKLITSCNRYDLTGYAVDGFSALENINCLDPDIALIDINMPLMSGLDVCRCLREFEFSGGIIILSSYVEPDIVLESFKNGADGYVWKFEAHDELHGAISEVVQKNKYISPYISEYVNKMSCGFY